MLGPIDFGFDRVILGCVKIETFIPSSIIHSCLLRRMKFRTIEIQLYGHFYERTPIVEVQRSLFTGPARSTTIHSVRQGTFFA